MSAIHYSARSPWESLLGKIDSDLPLEYKPNSAELPTALLQPTPNTRRRLKKNPLQSFTVCFDLVDAAGKLLEAHHGTSGAFDGLEDKDELVRTFQRCRADHLGLTPPSSLIRWDITLSECQNVIQELPVLEGNSGHNMSVLKEASGTGGKGVFFVDSVQQIYDIVEAHRNRAAEEGEDFLDRIMEQKGRIPAWVLQAEVYPARLIAGRKFHLRTYVLANECLEEDHLVNIYIYNRHEVRSAAVAVDDAETKRDRLAHITNAAAAEGTTQQLLSEVEDLASQQPALEFFVARTLNHLITDIARRVGYTAQDEPPEIQKHVLAGLDIMMTSDNRFYLLEVNVNPATPPLTAVSKSFEQHLVNFMQDMKNLLFGHSSPNFLLINDVIQRGANGGGEDTVSAAIALVAGKR
jgi:hypothetical protein